MENTEKTPEQIAQETAAEAAEVTAAIKEAGAEKQGFCGKIKAFFGKKAVKCSLWITGGLAVVAAGVVIAMKVAGSGETSEG